MGAARGNFTLSKLPLTRSRVRARTDLGVSCQPVAPHDIPYNEIGCARC